MSTYTNYSFTYTTEDEKEYLRWMLGRISERHVDKPSAEICKLRVQAIIQYRELIKPRDFNTRPGMAVDKVALLQFIQALLVTETCEYARQRGDSLQVSLAARGVIKQ